MFHAWRLEIPLGIRCKLLLSRIRYLYRFETFLNAGEKVANKITVKGTVASGMASIPAM